MKYLKKDKIIKLCLYNVTTTIKIGGIETFYWEVARELHRRGDVAELIAGEGPVVKYDEIPLQTFPFTPRDRILDLGNRFRKWGERLSFFRHAWPYLKKEKYDLFLIHKPLDFFVAYFVKKASPETKILFVSGGEDFYGFDRFFSKYVDKMVAVSNDNAKKIEERYKRTVPVVPNGVDIERFKPMPDIRKKMRRQMGIDENITTLVSVGRIVGWKGFQLVIEALARLPEYHYLLIGDGEYLKTLQNMAENLGVADRVHFIGAIDNQDLPKYLNTGDLFIQPSIGHEAFGITLLEAMACDLPVIASRNGGMVDIIQRGSGGYLFDKGNKEEMIQTIEKAIKSPSTESPRNYVLKHFSWSKTVDKLLKEINDEK